MESSFKEAAARLEVQHQQLQAAHVKRQREVQRGQQRAANARRASTQRRIKHEQEERRRAQRETQETEQRREQNRGVVFSRQDGLRLTRKTCRRFEEQLRARGIRRSEDKALCDSSMRRELLDMQGAARNGPVHLLVTYGDKKTYVCVLDWTAEKNTLGVGRKAQLSLSMTPTTTTTATTMTSRGDDAGNRDHDAHRAYDNEEDDDDEEEEEETDGGGRVRVRVEYVILPKGKSAVLRPRKKAFFEEFDEPKIALEASLVTCATLAEGDVLQCGNQLVDVVRVEMEEEEEGEREGRTSFEWAEGMPRGISIIETDLEVEIVPSKEEEDEARRVDEARQAALRVMDALKEMLVVNAEKDEAEDVEMRDIDRNAVSRTERSDDDVEGGVAVALRLPQSGSRVVRRFVASSSVSSLFAWADACGVTRELRHLSAESHRTSRITAAATARKELDAAEIALRARVSSSGAAIEALDALRERVNAAAQVYEDALLHVRESREGPAVRAEYVLVAPGGISVHRDEQRSLGELGLLGASLLVRAV